MFSRISIPQESLKFNHSTGTPPQILNTSPREDDPFLWKWSRFKGRTVKLWGFKSLFQGFFGGRRTPKIQPPTLIQLCTSDLPRSTRAHGAVAQRYVPLSQDRHDHHARLPEGSNRGNSTKTWQFQYFLSQLRWQLLEQKNASKIPYTESTKTQTSKYDWNKYR